MLPLGRSLLLLAAGIAAADDGIWLFEQFPKARVEKAHGIAITDRFLDRLRLASTRLEGGGSGSLVSPRGLVFTNHHVASDCVQKLSSNERDFLGDGFFAATEADEKPCPDEAVNILVEIKDVTAGVNRGIGANASAAEANRLRKENRTRLEQDCSGRAGESCEVVTLFSGGRYHLYRYKKYTDVRLVFAPEVAIAAFGGDPDNFTFPRYCLDVAFLRVYENGKPAVTQNFLPWSKQGAREGELAFVSGHPANTGRLAPMAELTFYRDTLYPPLVASLSRAIADVQRYSAASAANKREAQDLLFSLQNSYKAYFGFLGGLLDAELMARKKDEEASLRAGAAKTDPRGNAAGVWPEVEQAYRAYATFARAHYFLESRPGRGSELFDLSRKVFRYTAEKAKPDEKRLREYASSSLPRVEQRMFAQVPIEPELEIVLIGSYLDTLRRELGPSNETVRAALNGRTPQAAAADYVRSSKLASAEERKRLAADPAAAASSNDGMIRLMRILDPEARRLRARFEDQVEAVTEGAAARIGKVRFALFGAEDYPDATFTLRLSFGPAIGYRNAAGKQIPWATDFAGLYRRATGKEPFHLPKRWRKPPPGLALNTPFNFVTTADTHGGNSGSPTVNAQGAVTGILFDGNLEGLPNRFVYRDRMERSVHVASQGIAAALRSVYGAGRILKELGVE